LGLAVLFLIPLRFVFFLDGRALSVPYDGAKTRRPLFVFASSSNQEVAKKRAVDTPDLDSMGNSSFAFNITTPLGHFYSTWVSLSEAGIGPCIGFSPFFFLFFALQEIDATLSPLYRRFRRAVLRPGFSPYPVVEVGLFGG
jgi:hypothetical protein